MPSHTPRDYIRQREACQRGDMLYVGGSNGEYHLPGQTRDDKVTSLCAHATGRVGLWNVFTEGQIRNRQLCPDCLHLSPVERVARSVEGYGGQTSNFDRFRDGDYYK